MAHAGPIEDLLTLDEVEQWYHVKRSTLYRYIQKGHLSTYRRAMDKRVYVQRADIEALRRFRPPEGRSGLTIGAVQRARDFQRRVFGERALAVSSAELIEETRHERTAELP